MFERIRKFENLHILFWLGKDISWCLEWKIMGLIMIVPTFLLAVVITFITRHNRKELFHNFAICMWISANSLWIVGEFYGHESFRGIAKYLFIIGITAILWYYTSDFLLAKKTEETENSNQ